MYVVRFSSLRMYEVGYFKLMVGGGQTFEASFKSPKQAVAMAVCNLLNGGPTEVHDNICMINDFLKADAAKLYNTNEYL